jgi:hypothetical protein
VVEHWSHAALASGNVDSSYQRRGWPRDRLSRHSVGEMGIEKRRLKLQRRYHLLNTWREGITSIDSEIHTDVLRSPWYETLRPYLSEGQRNRLEKPRTVIVPSDAGRGIKSAGRGQRCPAFFGASVRLMRCLFRALRFRRASAFRRFFFSRSAVQTEGNVSNVPGASHIESTCDDSPRTIDNDGLDVLHSRLVLGSQVFVQPFDEGIPIHAARVSRKGAS